MMQNRRKFNRIQSDGTPARLTLDGQIHNVSLINESIEGLRVGSLSLEHLFVDQEIEIEFDEQVASCKCRSVSRNDSNEFEIGVLRNDSPLTGSNVDKDDARLLGHFVRLQSNWIACQVSENFKLKTSTGSTPIRLLNGKEFVLDRNQVALLTADEREKMLADEEDFKTTLELYQVLDASLEFENVKSLVEFEFSNNRSN